MIVVIRSNVPVTTFEGWYLWTGRACVCWEAMVEAVVVTVLLVLEMLLVVGVWERISALVVEAVLCMEQGDRGKRNSAPHLYQKEAAEAQMPPTFQSTAFVPAKRFVVLF